MITLLIRGFCWRSVFQYENLKIGENVLLIQQGREQRKNAQQNALLEAPTTLSRQFTVLSPLLEIAFGGAVLGAIAVASAATFSALASSSLLFLATIAAAAALVFQAFLLLGTEQVLLREGMAGRQEYYIPRWAMGLSWSMSAFAAAAAALSAGAGLSVAVIVAMCSAAICGTMAFVFRDQVWAMTGRVLPGIRQAAATLTAWIGRRPGQDAWGGYSGHVLCLLISYIVYDIVRTEWRMAELLQRTQLQPTQQ
jgi:hypothetical protein